MKRRDFFAAAGVSALASPTQRAEAVEQHMILELEGAGASLANDPQKTIKVERGAGRIFVPPGLAGATARDYARLEAMPARPTLLDFFEKRFAKRHVCQSAARALRLGMDEDTVLACLLHDVVLDLVRPDHGWWGAQLLEPYVAEKVAWAIRYHQALRFYPDPAVGYEYPKLYIEMFGADYRPDAYIEEAYKYARNHKWYMEARNITLNDDYSFDPNVKISMDPFVEIIGRRFKQPKEGLGFDGSPSAHMWRTLIHPERPL
jgi:hypothetical protein